MALLHATMTLALAAAEPRVRLECGTELRGGEMPGVHAYQGLRFAEPPERFAEPQDTDCADGVDEIDARAPGSMCAQAASPGLNLLTLMDMLVMPYAIYLLPLLALIFGGCAARGVWTFDPLAYSDLERPTSNGPPAWSYSPRVRGCSIAALLSMLLLFTLPGWAKTGIFGDEDCLYLNVYVPAAPSAEPRAVMVWVHGGAFLVGTGRLDDPTYGSSIKMPQAGVVHVTLNYRLGAFGWLVLGDGSISPNLGLLDQLSALRWVQRHIASFGGDPAKVLLYGHSAGGASVLALQRMPAAKGLFRAAASMSPLSRIGSAPADAAVQWKKALEPTGCAEIGCLKKLSTYTLARLNVLGSGVGAFGTIPLPGQVNHGPDAEWVRFVVEDGVSLTTGWQVDVPILIGGCREQGDFGPPDVLTMGYGAPTPAWPLTRESFGSWASDAGLSEESTDAVWSLYGRVAEGRQKWAQIGTDITLFCGLRAVAANAAKAGRSSPIYLNIFGYAVPFTYMGMFEVTHAAEGIDIWMTWGEPSAEPLFGFKLDDKAIAVGDAFRAYLVGFANEGTLGSAWKPYPAVCEYETSLECSVQNPHARACDIYDEAFGRLYDIEVG